MPKVTIKENYRMMAGVDKNHRCGECEFCHRRTVSWGRYCYKCKNMGESMSRATDIRLKDFACKFFENKRRID